MHVKDDVAAWAFEYVPVGQGVHTAATNWPVKEEYVPALQRKQDAAPALGAYVPLLHVWQVEEVLAPAIEEYGPAEH